MVSGSTGIIGAVDSIYVLEKGKRIENSATLHVTGRDIEDMQIKLEFDRDPPVWRFISYGDKKERGAEPIIPLLSAFMADRTEFTGTATDLHIALSSADDSKTELEQNRITANNLSRKLKEHQLTLEKSHNIKVSFERKNTARLIILSKVTNDSGFTASPPSQMGLDDVVAPADVVTTENNAVTTAEIEDAPKQGIIAETEPLKGDDCTKRPVTSAPSVTDDSNSTTANLSLSKPQAKSQNRDGNNNRGSKKKHRHPSPNANKASKNQHLDNDGNSSNDSKSN